MGLSELIRTLQRVEHSFGNVEVFSGSMDMLADEMQNVVISVVAVFEEDSQPNVILITE
jgi:hypothetical protein